jgi:hypothetical protein
MCKKKGVFFLTALLGILLGSAAALADFRVQPEFVADDWSKYHVLGGSASYLLTRNTAHPFGYSLAIATAWEIGDAFKPEGPLYHDWRDDVLTSDGFSYSDIVYHMAGTYLTWLIFDASKGRIVFTLR